MKDKEKKLRLLRLEEMGLMPTVAILKNLFQLGVLSRTFMLKEHDLMLKDLTLGVGKYSKYSIQQREWLESLVYIELLERICFLIEDFAKVINGLNSDLRKFQENLIHSPKPDTILSRLNYESWNKILHYAELKSLPISERDKQFLKDIRNRSCKQLQTIVEFCSDFFKLHKIFFNKFKHGNSIIYGFKKVEINGEPSFLIPAVYNRRQPDKVKPIIVNRTIYEKWKTFNDAIVILIRDLIERTIAFIERDCTPFAEYVVAYCYINPDEKNRVNKIIAKCDSKVVRINIISNIELPVGKKDLKRFNDLYDKFDNIKQSAQIS